jgi:hypothetical protein
MDLTPEKLQEFDRKMRSYITAILLGDEQEMGEIAKSIMEYKDHPAYTVMLLSSYGAIAAYLLSLMADSENVEEIFNIWSEISQEIELEAIFGNEI